MMSQMIADTKGRRSIDAVVEGGTSTSGSCHGRIDGSSNQLASTLTSVTVLVTTLAAVTSEISSDYRSSEVHRRVQGPDPAQEEITGHVVSRSHPRFLWCICQQPRTALLNSKSRRFPTWSWTTVIVHCNSCIQISDICLLESPSTIYILAVWFFDFELFYSERL